MVDGEHTKERNELVYAAPLMGAIFLIVGLQTNILQIGCPSEGLIQRLK
jgi:hypothetical protein